MAGSAFRGVDYFTGQSKHHSPLISCFSVQAYQPVQLLTSPHRQPSLFSSGSGSICRSSVRMAMSEDTPGSLSHDQSSPTQKALFIQVVRSPSGPGSAEHLERPFTDKSPSCREGKEDTESVSKAFMQIMETEALIHLICLSSVCWAQFLNWQCLRVNLEFVLWKLRPESREK